MKGDPLSHLAKIRGIISTFVRNKDAPDLTHQTVMDSISADFAQTWKGESLNRGLHLSHLHSLHS